jgi:hypothetical protein
MKIEDLIKKYNVNFRYEMEDENETIIEIPCEIVCYYIEDFYYEEKGEAMYLTFELKPLNHQWDKDLNEDVSHDIWHSLKNCTWDHIAHDVIPKP